MFLNIARLELETWSPLRLLSCECWCTTLFGRLSLEGILPGWAQSMNGQVKNWFIADRNGSSLNSLHGRHGLKGTVFTFGQRTFFTVSTMCCTRGRLWLIPCCDWLQNTRFARLSWLCSCEDWNLIVLDPVLDDFMIQQLLKSGCDMSEE